MTDEKGETFFVGKDVAEALGYKNYRDAIGKHVDMRNARTGEALTVEFRSVDN